jgi:type IV secretion system protein TrbL
MSDAIGAAGGALSSAARDKAIGVPGTWGASTLGLANAKLDERRNRSQSGQRNNNADERQ